MDGILAAWFSSMRVYKPRRRKRRTLFLWVVPHHKSVRHRAIDPFGIWMDGILAAWFSSMRVYKAAP